MSLQIRSSRAVDPIQISFASLGLREKLPLAAAIT
jgi:hypothetical protein